jgi:MFS family permease
MAQSDHHSHLDTEPKLLTPLAAELTEAAFSAVEIAEESLEPQFKTSIRNSLKASTVDGVFAAIYSGITGGVLVTNFLMDLGASTVQIGLVASIPLAANLMQPLGAYFSERMTSRHWFCLWVYVPARLLWLILALGVGLLSQGVIDAQMLIDWTLAIALLSYGVGALGSAAWLSWMAVLVPRRLRGRYFGLRNSASNLTSLVAVPLAGTAIASFPGGSVQGFGIALVLAILFGLISLMFQNFMADVNPQLQQSLAEPDRRIGEQGPLHEAHELSIEIDDIIETSKKEDSKNKIDFWMFLIYYSGWMFAFSLSAPFFNLYMLDNLNLSISQVTLYSSLMAGANLMLLTTWGWLADRFGNSLLLLGGGLVAALTPLLWLFVGTGDLSVWLGLPLLHVIMGGSISAIELCANNLQIGVSPIKNQSSYLGWISAGAGVSGALGATLGGYLAEHWQIGGLLGLFILSSGCRLVALFPLFFVREHRSLSLGALMQLLVSPNKSRDPEIVS